MTPDYYGSIEDYIPKELYCKMEKTREDKINEIINIVANIPRTPPELREKVVTLQRETMRLLSDDEIEAYYKYIISSFRS